LPGLLHPLDAVPDGTEGLVALVVADLPAGFELGKLPGVLVPQDRALVEVLKAQIGKFAPGVAVDVVRRKIDLAPDIPRQQAALVFLCLIEDGPALPG
jgi:hypothetical protein